MQHLLMRRTVGGRHLRLVHSPSLSPILLIALRARLYSTPVVQKQHQVSAADAPLGAASTKKPRSSLHPAPRPTENANSSANTQSSAASLAISRQTQSSTAPSASQLQPSSDPPHLEKPSIFQTMKEDFESAERLGILQSPPEGAGKWKTGFLRAKELVKFYFRGARLIITNAQTAYHLSRRVKSGGEPLTRDEWHLVRASNGDLVRLVPFVLLTLVLEEAVPLLVLYLPGMLPSTCLLPSQKDRIAAKQAERQAWAMAEGRAAVTKSLSYIAAPTVASLDSVGVKTFCGFFSLSRWAPTFLLRQRLQRHLAYIAQDDQYLYGELAQRKSLASLTSVQLRDAILERGLVRVFPESRDVQQKQLEDWVKAVQRGDESTPFSLVLRQ
ncbi:hypothetical protein BKA62DRAFT_681356 [Auriculariales sp. MPI-PUGE-AT-0066]|nr:hypothetical protein BKA62DRAFT_681356 [Auriculariales sp. MPI-PUGE-AT-0066]